MDSVEILGRYPPPEYSVLGRITPGPGGTFVASAALVNGGSQRIPLTFLSGFPYKTSQEARTEATSFVQNFGYSLEWES